MATNPAGPTACTDFVLPWRDPDRPFAFEDYVAIASTARQSGRCTVWTSTLPYGMWWQELRPLIDLGHGDPPDRSAPLDGVWKDRKRWIARDDRDYCDAVEVYRAVAWLDDASESVS